MASIGSVLNSEIRRLSRREVRPIVDPLRKASAVHRRDIAALKRRIQELEQQVRALARASQKRASPAQSVPASRLRFVAKGFAALRARLGLSAGDMALLLGVSGQTIYNWEHRKSIPARSHVAAISELRSTGKREARRRVETLAASGKAGHG